MRKEVSVKSRCLLDMCLLFTSQTPTQVTIKVQRKGKKKTEKEAKYMKTSFVSELKNNMSLTLHD